MNCGEFVLYEHKKAIITITIVVYFSATKLGTGSLSARL